MAVFHHQITINRPIEAVFAVIADASTHPQWQEGLIRTDAQPNTNVQVGTHGVEVRKMFGREVRFPYEIIAFDPPHKWGFRALAGPVRPSAILNLSSQNGSTLVESELTVPGLLGSFMGRMLLSQQESNYKRLKEMMEAGKL
jgi:uncharacterized protein YndB with AHSA1/START domain